MYKSEKKEDPLLKARENLVEKISVAGWKEAADEPSPWIRYSYRTILAVFSCACVYYVGVGIDKWLKSGYTNDITDFNSVDSIPMPNVSVCAQVYVNQTYIKQNVTIPDAIMSDLKKQGETVVEEFYKQLSLYLSIMIRERRFSRVDMARFKRIFRANPQLMDASDFQSRAVVRCEQMLKRCWFDGEEFDCCSLAVRSYDDDGVCYTFAMNRDSDNAYPSVGTRHQRRSGPVGGLTVEASLKVSEFPFLDNEMQNGFRLLIGHVPFSVTASPVAAPDLSETYVKVIPERRILATHCASRNNLRMPGGEFMYYDPDGFSCIVREFTKVAHKYTQCQFVGYFNTPNVSAVCDPVVHHMLSAAFSVSQVEFLANANFSKQLEDDWKSSLSDKARCPNHCQYWTYTSTASFVYLDKEHVPEDIMFSKIHIYYGEMGFRQRSQVKEITSELAFNEFGNVVGFYWGMSIVSFFHVVYYVAAYVYAKRKWAGRQNRVEDIST